jgi:hypothetical protein
VTKEDSRLTLRLLFISFLNAMSDYSQIDFKVVDELVSLAREATPGPWRYFPKSKYNEHHVSLPVEGGSMRLALFADGCRTERPEQDAKFIAEANPQTVLSLALYAQSAKVQLEARTPTGHEKLIKNLVSCLKDAEASLRKVTKEGTQYDSMDIYETMSGIKHAFEAVQAAGLGK